MLRLNPGAVDYAILAIYFVVVLGTASTSTCGPAWECSCSRR